MTKTEIEILARLSKGLPVHVNDFKSQDWKTVARMIEHGIVTTQEHPTMKGTHKVSFLKDSDQFDNCTQTTWDNRKWISGHLSRKDG